MRGSEDVHPQQRDDLPDLRGPAAGRTGLDPGPERVSYKG